MDAPGLRHAIDSDGYALLRNAISETDCDWILADWEAACAVDAHGLMRNAQGEIVGARNILDMWPGVAEVVDRGNWKSSLKAILGESFSLVRILYFDKPPGDSWALPWHKDLAIAVQDNGLTSSQFDHPTSKYGVPHVEAPVWLLEQMLTARIHLDEVTEENGPLKVAPASHREGKQTSSCENPVRITCQRGDILLMRPLLSHASGHCDPQTKRHRRILHLEFANTKELPEGFVWRWCVGQRDR